MTSLAQLDLDTLHLDRGAHTCTDGACLFEAYSLIRYGTKTDRCPADVSPVLHRFGMNLNDAWDDTARQQLKRYLPHGDVDPLSGTRDGQDEARSYLALDWLIRTFTPAWLDLAGLTESAAEMRALRRIVDMSAAQSAGPLVRDARTKAAAAWDAAGAAAWAAAGAAAGAAAWDAAWDAAGAAAWAAAGDAAGAAAGAAAGDAAWAAAWAAAGAAAGDAAWDAAGAAAWAAAGAAAGDATQPTVTTLQASALDLFDRMIDPAAARVA